MSAAATFALTRTVLSRIVASPFGALALAVALAAWPLATVAAPLGIRRYSSTSTEWCYELAFVSGAVGVGLGTAARKRLDPLIEISAHRPSPHADLWTVAVCGALFYGIALLPAAPLAHASDLGICGFLPWLAVAAAWSALAMRLLPGVEAAAWSAAAGSALLPTILPTTHYVLRSTATATALVLGAVLVDHPPARER